MATASTAPLKHLGPGWFGMVMGLAGLALAWHAASPVLGSGAAAAGLVISAIAALVWVALLLASLLRLHRHPSAWADDLRHPVRQLSIAAPPIALLLLAAAAVAAGLDGGGVDALWWLASLAQLSVTGWVLWRWWRVGAPSGLRWAGLAPPLILPIVGNVLVPLAGVQLGHGSWAAVQFGLGALLWPLVLAVLLLRFARQGLWAERLLPSTFIFLAPPAAVGLSALRLNVPVMAVWALWGLAVLTLLALTPLLRRIAAQPFGIVHWGMSFPMAAFSSLTLRLAPAGAMQTLGLALLAVTSLLVAALVLATWRGLREGSLLAPETVPLATAA